MFVLAAYLGIFVTNTISSTQINVQYTEEDFAVIRRFTKSLKINNLVFVTHDENSGVINCFKHNSYSAVLSSDQLNEILNVESVRNFFASATIIVSKESLNHTMKSQRLSEKYSLVWIVFTNTLKQLQDFYIPMNTDFYTVQYTRHAVVINRAYHIKPDINITLELTGVWRREDVDTITINRSRTYDFNGVTLGMLHFLDEECKALKSLDFLNRIECFQQEILRILTNKLNFRIRNIDCPEKVYPYNYPNGSLSYLFYMLDDKEVDLSSGSYIINLDRLAKYDFVWPVFTSRSMMYIRERKQNIWRGYLRPIHKYLWQAMCVWIVGVGFLFHVFEECRKNRFELRLSLLSDTIKSVFTSLQVFCGQGINDMSEWYSTRILFLMSFLLFVILYEMYSGFLISFLMIDVPNIPFTDIKGFFRDGRFKLLSLNKGFHNYFTNKIMQDYKQDPATFKLPLEELPETINEGIKILCHGRRLTYVEFRENLAMHEIPCKITELPHSVLHQSVGLGLRKYSPFREPLYRGVILCNSAGLIQRMKKQLFYYANLKEKEISTEEYVKVSLKHVVSIFFILAMGIVFAWGLFVLEVSFVLLMKLSRKLKNRSILARSLS